MFFALVQFSLVLVNQIVVFANKMIFLLLQGFDVEFEPFVVNFFLSLTSFVLEVGLG